MIGTTWQHNKRGGIYTVVGRLRLNSAHAEEGHQLNVVVYRTPNHKLTSGANRLFRADDIKSYQHMFPAFQLSFSLVCNRIIHRGDEVILYVGSDERRWARPEDEFLDGRFTDVTP